MNDFNLKYNKYRAEIEKILNSCVVNDFPKSLYQPVNIFLTVGVKN